MSAWLRLVDRFTERGVRRVAQRHGRRSWLTRVGVLIAGGPLLPMLPFDRSGQAGSAFAAWPALSRSPQVATEARLPGARRSKATAASGKARRRAPGCDPR